MKEAQSLDAKIWIRARITPLRCEITRLEDKLGDQ